MAPRCYALGMLPMLRVSNGYAQGLPGLGKLPDFRTLSQKRITACARDALGRKYGYTLVKVSRCSIKGESLEYCISPAY